MTPRVRRDWLNWALAAFAGIAGIAAVTFSAAQVIAVADPAAAHRLAPYDGRITAQYAMSLTKEQATAADRRRSDILARQAIRQDPSAVVALSTLGLDAAVRGEREAARRLFTQAQKLSRRDLPTQISLIEDAVERGDVSETLRHYDIALRVKVEMSNLLFPILAGASTDPAIRRALVRTYAARPPWGERFLSYLTTSGTDPRAAVALLAALRRTGAAIPPKADADVINALLASDYDEQAWSYYSLVRPGADRRRARDLRVASIASPSRLDWVPANGDGLSVAVHDGVIDMAVAPGSGGALVRQEQLLPAGAYRLSGRAQGLEQAGEMLPYWTLTCGPDRELGRVGVTNSRALHGNFTGVFTVPAGCPRQTLTLVALPIDSPTGLSGQVDRVSLTPLSR